MSIPTIADIKAQFLADMKSDLGKAAPIFNRSFVHVIAKAIAGVVAMLHRRVLWASAQIHPETAEEPTIAFYENRYGITPSPATSAVLAITILGDEGSEAPAGTLWTDPESGIVFAQDRAAPIVSGSASAQVEALTAGAETTLATGARLYAVETLPGIAAANVTAVVLEGEDATTLDARRAAIIARIRRTDDIGTAAYFARTAAEVAGVVKAHVKGGHGSDIVVYPLAALAGPNRVPDASSLAAVGAYLRDDERRPMGANVYALAATERTATVTIAGLSPNDSETKATIEAALEAYFYAAYPRQLEGEVDTTDVLSIGEIWAIIVNAGAIASSITLELSDVGVVTNYTLNIGEIVKLGSIAW